MQELIEDPGFRVYAVAAALMCLKLLLQGWMTAYRMTKAEGGMLNPEDLRNTVANRNPRPEQLEPNEYVERSRRMHRNDLEIIPAFLIAGLLFVLTGPPLWLAQLLLYGFVVTRVLYSIAYATAQNHEVRAAFFGVGSLACVGMAAYVGFVFAFG